MGFLDKLIAEGKALLDTAPHLPDEIESVKADRFDHSEWGKVRGQAPKVQREIDGMAQEHDYVHEFVQDFFSMAYKGDPQLRAPEEMKPSHVGNRAMAERLYDMPEFKNLRQHTVGDEYNSAMAMMAMAPVIKEVLVEAKKQTEEAARQQDEAQKQMQKAQQELAEALASMAMQPQTPDGQPSKGEQDLQAKMDQFNKQKQEFNAAQQQTQQQAQQAGNAVAGAMRAAADKADQSQTEDEQLMQSFGVDDGVLQRMSFEERFALSQKIRDNRLAKFAKLLGQFKMVQQAESRKRVVNAASEVHGVKVSDDLERLTVGEYLNFADEDLELLFWLRYTEQQLLTYDVRGREKQGQGPIICVVDESGSMGATDVAGGTREAWSKALALALFDQANQRKREFIYIGFSSARQIHVVRFVPGEPNMDKVLEMTEHFFAGGTHYEGPLRRALEIIETEFDDKKLSRPDIVFMTDDEYGSMDEGFMHEWNRIKDKTDVKCYGIAIGCSVGGALKAVSDDVREITELASDPRVMGDVFRTL